MVYKVTMVTGMRISHRKSTYGALDMGGASAQITFEPEDPEALPAYARLDKSLYGHDYSLYSQSFVLRFGGSYQATKCKYFKGMDGRLKHGGPQWTTSARSGCEIL